LLVFSCLLCRAHEYHREKHGEAHGHSFIVSSLCNKLMKQNYAQPLLQHNAQRRRYSR
jgi:hypothetical protein